jgi:hypothetical protein
MGNQIISPHEELLNQFEKAAQELREIGVKVTIPRTITITENKVIRLEMEWVGNISE